MFVSLEIRAIVTCSGPANQWAHNNAHLYLWVRCIENNIFCTNKWFDLAENEMKRKGKERWIRKERRNVEGGCLVFRG
jgi:hypothetical protein